MVRPGLPLLLTSALFGCGAGPPAAPAGEDRRGEQLYAAWNCGVCHGENRQGTEFGPALTRLSTSWREETLAAFLADPEAVRRKDPRLLAYQARFPAPMPAFLEPEGDRKALSGWLLRAESAR